MPTMNATPAIYIVLTTVRVLAVVDVEDKEEEKEEEESVLVFSDIDDDLIFKFD